MEYGVFTFWGLLGYAKRCCGAASLLDSWPGKFSRQRNVVIWNMIPHCLMWVLGEREMLRPLKGMKDQSRTLSSTFSRPYLNGPMQRVFSLLIICLDLIGRCSFLES